MGTYVYAFNTKVRQVSGFKLAVAEYRYKPHTTMFGAEDANKRLYNRLCGRRISFFENHPEQFPDFFVLCHRGELKEGLNVLVAKHGVAFADYVKFEKAGTLVKKGRSWEIQFCEGYPKAKTETEVAA